MVDIKNHFFKVTGDAINESHRFFLNTEAQSHGVFSMFLQKY